MAATRARIRLTVFLAAAAAIAYLCRTSLTVAEKTIRLDLGLSELQMGFLLGPAFFWPYALAQLPGGWLGDRLGHSLRLALVAGSMTLLSIVHLLFGPWQVRWVAQTATRRALFFAYLPLDGMLSCLVEPQLMPMMLGLAEQQQSRLADEPRTSGLAHEPKASDEPRSAALGTGEHLTNLVRQRPRTERHPPEPEPAP